MSEIADEIAGARMNGGADPAILAVDYDSRKVVSGSLFVAVPGLKSDGNEFVRDAAARGAVAVILERPLSEPSPLPTIHVQNARKALAEAAWALFDHPERDVVSVGITGTNGKTTTSTLLKSVLEAGGKRTGLVGTLGIQYGDTEVDSPRTTPESSDLAMHCAAMRDEGFTHVVMEATSIGIDLDRVWGIPFQAAVFTNLTRDHLDYHRTEEAYRNAKLRLFRNLAPRSTAVINHDDPAAPAFIDASAGEVCTYALDRDADFRAADVRLAHDATTFRLESPHGTHTVHAPLIGFFNVYNILAVAATAYALGIPVTQTCEALKSARPVRGRAEIVPLRAPFSVVVDYAHTPDALEKILVSLRSLARARVITVVGAGGDRDKGKRPLMAGAAARHSDVVILTSDNPRGEDPESILDDMESGLPQKSVRERTSDRRRAIRLAMQMAQEDDLVLVAGKGHETYQEIQGVKYPFDDRQVVLESYAELAK